uniref:ABC transporter E family member 2-like n=1 Tax=Erigeron canadensis TaxID=72917 RepID=UPI001CB9832F|nr:ABC transporter E family member 2-like [Erigeron canadensis]
MSKTLGGFTLNVVAAKFTDSQIILLHGQPGTGKTTFIKLLAGVKYPDTIQGNIPCLSVSYKPQIIRPSQFHSVRALFKNLNCSLFEDPCFVSTVTEPLEILPLMDKRTTNLLDSQLQRDADIYLIDEPTASLDQVERDTASQVIKRFIQRFKRTALVIEHNHEVASYLADKVIVFEGTPSVNCVANPPIQRNEVPRYIYLINEPTASINHVQLIQHTKKAAFVIEHNLEVASYPAHSVIVFEGTPLVDCFANPHLNEP